MILQFEHWLAVGVADAVAGAETAADVVEVAAAGAETAVEIAVDGAADAVAVGAAGAVLPPALAPVVSCSGCAFPHGSLPVAASELVALAELSVSVEPFVIVEHAWETFAPDEDSLRISADELFGSAAVGLVLGLQSRPALGLGPAPGLVPALLLVDLRIPLAVVTGLALWPG